MKILVTGATGFVGSHLMKELNRDDVSILSRKQVSGRKVYVGDLFNKRILSEATKADIIVHLAGISKGSVLKINYEGTKNLVDACINNKIKRFIFISSFDAVLNTKYGKSKLKAEEYIKNSGLDYIIIRPTFIYGKNNKEIYKLIKYIKMGVVPIPGNGNFKLQPVFVDDVIKLIVKSINAKNKNKIYFIGGSQKLTFNELVGLISKALKKNPIKINIPKFLIKLINEGLIYDKVCDNSNIEKEFNIYPRRFDQEIKNLIKA